MKKLVVFISLLFLMACGGEESKEIKQNIGYDNVTNNYSITTTFGYPKTYSSCVYCAGPKIDSIRKVELNKAAYIQDEMLKNNN